MLSTFLLFISIAHAAAFPSPVGHVNDFALMLSESTRSGLEQRLVQLQSDTGSEVAVATIESLNGDSIEQVAGEIFQQWGIGKKKEDNGLLLLIAKNDRKARFEVGYGLEGVLTDVGTSRIQREILVPAFQKGDYDGGIVGSIDAVEKALRGDASINAPAPSETRGSSRIFFNPIGIFYLIVILFSWLGSVLGRSKSWWAGGVGGVALGFLIGIIFLPFIGAIVSAVIAGLLGAVFDYYVSKNYATAKQAGIRPRWWAGGGWGGGRGGGGGFGGFGGGSSGGGGSSSSW